MELDGKRPEDVTPQDQKQGTGQQRDLWSYRDEVWPELNSMPVLPNIIHSGGGMIWW